MGCGASTPREPNIVYGTGQLVHISRKSYTDVPLLQMYKNIEDQLVSEIQERRTNRNAATERLIRARGAEGLQARGSLMSILSTSADVFVEFLADCPEYADMPTFGFNASNAIPGSFMLARANEVQEAIQGRGGFAGYGGDGDCGVGGGGGGGGGGHGGPRIEPNAPLLGAALEDVLRFKALWGSRLLAVTLLMVDHPSLGRVALVQPLLLAACMQRLHNWALEVDPVFGELLKAGSCPNSRNSLNMTALLLVATSLITHLQSHIAYGGGGGSSGGEAVAGQVGQAAAVASATTRLLLAAGADAAAEMRGFGAQWDPSSRAAELLPGPIRAARHVLCLERYTAHKAFEVMRRTIDEQIQAAGPDAVRHLDEFAALLLPPPPPGPGAAAAEERSNMGIAEASVGPAVEAQLQQRQQQQQQPQRLLQGQRLGELLGSACSEEGGAAEEGMGQQERAAGPESSLAAYHGGGDGKGAGDGACGSPVDGAVASGAGGSASALPGELPPLPLQQQGQQQPHPKQLQQQQQRYQEQQQQGGVRLQRPTQDVSWPWVQAMSNITWAVSQVSMAHSAAARRAFLRALRLEAPFRLPAMCVVSVEQLRSQGRIPRYSTRGLAEGPTTTAVPPAVQRPNGPRFQPLPVDELPPSAVVVFVSHRWLGRGCPDDDLGTKLKQVLAIADHVAAIRRVPLESVFLWLDYSVVDQDDPMPGVQALPVYIACCEEFVYIPHHEYWQRAWCLTEQFMHWKLATSDVKRVLQPTSLALTSESARVRPPDPTYGKLAVEADRVALATMTSILPYDVS